MAAEHCLDIGQSKTGQKCLVRNLAASPTGTWSRLTQDDLKVPLGGDKQWVNAWGQYQDGRLAWRV
jgi:hypothetical protein